MTILEAKKMLIDVIKTVYPASQYKYYSMAVVEGYERPCFFTQLKIIENQPSNYNSRRIRANFYIDYMQKEVDEADYLEVAESLQEAFGLYVKNENGVIYVGDVNWQYVGSERNVIEISVEVEWGVPIIHEDSSPLMNNFGLNLEMEE